MVEVRNGKVDYMVHSALWDLLENELWIYESRKMMSSLLDLGLAEQRLRKNCPQETRKFLSLNGVTTTP